MESVIIHVDMDAFFSSVEVMDNPSLKNKPVIVGGVSERGVVATCSYEARKFGVSSAMPIYKAKALCPKGIFLPTRHQRYKEVSNMVFELLYEITDKIEPVSIDEAYIDITDLKENPVVVALKIKSMIKMELGLNISIGISYNKFLAKLASDWNKPNGLKEIKKEMIPDILMDLPIKKVHGLGKKSVEKLNNIAIFTIRDLYDLPIEFMQEYFGRQGVDIYNRIRGIDNRSVSAIRERKSVGRETTLKKDTKDKTQLKRYLLDFSRDIATQLKKANFSGKTVTVKIKTASFENHTKSKTLNKYVFEEEAIYNEGEKILDSIELTEDIRLIGISISSLKKDLVEQLTLF
ncbi:DNA polymerase IV [Clostridium senegalense]|uniref:DNA polymerase IV n=1 Tax=Clostridium senegalense TaxID=1465809 RepID=UPI001C126B11|nr:DNA polymerase IV [Clostridium senegalense]MBU5228397.1 DNA polymerase IV [Clostridium senegalense]